MPPKVDKDRCNGCGVCLFSCGARCFEFLPSQYKAYLRYGRRCVDCLICEHTCPQAAITVRFRKTKQGDLTPGSTKNPR
jgi:NAD-dependent dihydropyrimidine dehydrogenase PreA subunit